MEVSSLLPWCGAAASLLIGLIVGIWWTRHGGLPGRGERDRPVLVSRPAEILIRPAEPILIRPSEPILIRPVIDQMPEIRPLSEAPDPVLITPGEYVLIRPTEPVLVQPPARGVWDDRGWIRRDNGRQRTYEGFYQTTEDHTGVVRRFPGRIVVEGNEAHAFIANPPPEIKQHPKAPCFMLIKEPWFRVNWARPARNVDEALLYLEKVLYESVNRKVR